MMGAASTPVFLVVFNSVLLILIALPLAVVIQLAWGGTWDSAIAQGMSAAALLFMTGGIVAFWLWWRKRLYRPIELGASWISSRPFGVNAGEKSLCLHRLLRMCSPIAEGWVISPMLLKQPDAAARQLVRRCKRRGIQRLIVRSSFLHEDSERLYPGVFRSVPDVNATDPEAIRAALEDVVASSRADIVDRYRQRTGHEPRSEQVEWALVQEYIQPDFSGVLCSFHPARRRLDEVTIEVTLPGESPPLVDVYSQLSRRWLSKETPLDSSARQELLDALRAGEALLQGPVVIEFGLDEGSIVVFQLRRAPPVPFVDLWTQSGPIGLNPQPLPKLFAEVLYGRELELLGERLEHSIGAHLAPSAPPSKPKIRLHHSRPVVEYGSIAACLRFHPRTQGPFALTIRILRQARLAERRAREEVHVIPKSSDVPSALRHISEIQSRCQEDAENLRTLSFTLAEAVKRSSEFAPLLPWHQWLDAVLQRTSRRLDLHRNQLHDELMSGLNAMCPGAAETDDWRHFTLDDWRRSRSGASPKSSPEDLERRRRAFQTDQAEIMPQALVEDGGDLMAAPSWPEQGRIEGSFRGSIELRPLVRGEAAGAIVFAAGSSPTEGRIVVVPDASIRWLDRVVDASGVLLVGGGQLLSHLALLILELEIPTLMGLTHEEAVALEGCTARIEDDRILFEDVA